MEASAGAAASPDELRTRLAELTLRVVEGLNDMRNRNVQQQSNMNGNNDIPHEREVNCPICFEQFNETHAPRTLRCGHTVCTPCLETIITRAAGDRNCPECRKPLKVTAVGHIPVSYTILRLARALEETCAAAAAAEAEVEEVNEAAVIGETCIHHHYPVLWWCSSCKAFQCRSCTHFNTCPERMPAGEAIVHVKQAQVEECERTVLALNKLKNDFEKQKDKLSIAIDRMMEEMKQLETKIKKVDQQVLAVEEAEALVVEASSVCRMTCALTRSETVQKNAKVWLENKDSRPSSPALSIGEDPIDFEILQQKLTICKDIYAVKTEPDGTSMYAKMSVYEDKILVHNYVNGTPPPGNALLVDAKTVLFTQADRKSFFFDIHVEGRFEGRVFIIQFRNTGMRKLSVFFELCTNSKGVTYKGLELRSLAVTGGDAMGKVTQIGSEIRECSTITVPRPESDNYFHRSIYPGLVSGLSGKSTTDTVNPTLPTPFTFAVYLYHMNGNNDPAGFGKVLSGLGVLRYAFDKRDAVIGDCGAVLPITSQW